MRCPYRAMMAVVITPMSGTGGRLDAARPRAALAWFMQLAR